MKCPECGKEFDPANRVGPTTAPGSEAQVRFCSEKCARRSENRRHYAAHKDKIKSRVAANQRGERDKTPAKPLEEDWSEDWSID